MRPRRQTLTYLGKSNLLTADTGGLVWHAAIDVKSLLREMQERTQECRASGGCVVMLKTPNILKAVHTNTNTAVSLKSCCDWIVKSSNGKLASTNAGNLRHSSAASRPFTNIIGVRYDPMGNAVTLGCSEVAA